MTVVPEAGHLAADLDHLSFRMIVHVVALAVAVTVDDDGLAVSFGGIEPVHFGCGFQHEGIGGVEVEDGGVVLVGWK